MTPETEDRTVPRKLFPEAVIDEMLRQIAAGASLASVCESNAGYPSRQSWARWVAEDVHLQQRYVRAIQLQVASRYAAK